MRESENGPCAPRVRPVVFQPGMGGILRGRSSGGFMVPHRLIRSFVAILSVALLTSTTGSAQHSAAKPSKGGASHTARQPRPIQLGVSGGNALDVANGFCCSGTLGALV